MKKLTRHLARAKKPYAWFRRLSWKRQVAISILVGIIVGFIPLFVIHKTVVPVFTPSYFVETQMMVKNGDTLSTLLSGVGVSGVDINEIDKLLKKQGNKNYLRAGADTITVTMNNRDPNSKYLEKLLIASGPWEQIIVQKGDKGEWILNSVQLEKDVRVVRKDGEIMDGDSFYLAGMRANIPTNILAEMYDLFSFDIDFERDVRVGQKFAVMYEEHYNKDGEFVSTGAVVFTEFHARGHLQMYRYKNSKGTIGYYDANGMGATKSLKRTPINNARVSSSFNLSRKHPVLGYTRAHRGVDFRAGTGTPIPAGGSGRVVERRYGSGYGNYVKIQHNATYATLYAHMSRFQKGVGVGSYVKQGQIIGYVGSTGLSSGPHLHYEIIRNGEKVNPLTVKLPSIDSLSDSEKKDFIAMRSAMDSTFAVLGKYPKLFVQLPGKF